MNDNKDTSSLKTANKFTASLFFRMYAATEICTFVRKKTGL